MISNIGLRAMILAAGVGSRLDPFPKQMSKPLGRSTGDSAALSVSSDHDAITTDAVFCRLSSRQNWNLW
jgi:hypothetical protein